MGRFATLLAEQTEFDRWLDKNPLVLGGIAFLIGAALLAYGARNILTGSAMTKWGGEVEGSEADMYGVIRMAAGVGLVMFGAYKLFTGLW